MAPLAWMLIEAASGAGRFSGADGPFAADQHQYLAWVRDAGEHVLASNRYDIAAADHVFLHPMFTLSGLGWRAFGGIEVWAVIWKPVAVAVLFAGFARFVRRHVTGARFQAAALVVALFYVSPAALLPEWPGLTAGGRALSGEMCSACMLWGYLPTAITLGLMPMYLLALERALARDDRRALAAACATGLLAAWLHPWQGETLVVVTVAMAAWHRDRLRVLAPAVAATAAPLLYYLLLSQLDAGWGVAREQNEAQLPAAGALAAAVAPLLALALMGVRRPRDDAERLLHLWPPATLLTYLLLSPSVPAHALEGLALPLAVLAARGAADRRVPAAAAVAAAVVLTVPALIPIVRFVHRSIRDGEQASYLAAGEAAALRFLDRDPRPGGVLTSAYLGSAVPAFTGRQTWVGHPSWSPGYATRAERFEAVLDGRADPGAARRVVTESGAAFVLTDCRKNADLRALLGPRIGEARRFGCAVVYEVRR